MKYTGWFWLLGLLSAQTAFPAWPAGVRSLRDDLGYTIELKVPPQRIVSLAPSNTELLFSLGLGERLVGVTDFCNYPEAALKLERVAGFNLINMEKIIAARPQLVVAARGNDREVLESLRQMGIAVFALDIRTIDQLLEAVERLGHLGGVEGQAAELRRLLTERVEKVIARIALATSHPRVMWGYWSEPIFTAGGHTMIDDVLSLAGGINVGRQAPGAWPQVGLETVVSWAPEVIVTTFHPQSGSSGALSRDLERLRQTDGWKAIPAVQQGRVFYIDADLLNRPGPRLIEALERIAAFFHPEVFE